MRIRGPMPPFAKVLVANRGDIAIRVFRTLRELGIGTVAVYSEADAAAQHVAVADEAFLLGPGPAPESYLRGDLIVDTARRAGAEAVHPGYGFLAENPDFAEAVEAEGIIWVGPPAAALRAGGDKLEAKRIAREAGVPVVPEGEPDEIGFPLMIKAAAGGGGRGMRLVRETGELEEALAQERAIEHAITAVTRVLADRGQLTRAQLADELRGRGVHGGGQMLMLLLAHAELEGLICSGGVADELPQPAGFLGDLG